MQVDAVATGKVLVVLGNNPLQEYIDRAYNVGCLVIGRDASIPRHIWLIGWAKVHELNMVQHNGLVPYTCAHASDPSHKMDWHEIMSWYPPGGTIFSVGSIVQQGPLDMRRTTCSSWWWEGGQ